MSILVIYLAILASNNLHHIPTTLEEFFVRLFPFVPSLLWHSFGFYTYWFLSFYMFDSLEKIKLWTYEDCFETPSEENIKIIVTTLKSGTVLSSMVGYDLFRLCKLKASVTKPSETDIWPWIVNPPPDHEVDLFIALGNPMNWSSILSHNFNSKRKLQCVVLTRNPFNRLLSLYKYSRDGGESGLKKISRELEKISSLKERLIFLWNNLGQVVMTKSHEPVLEALTDYKCTQLRVDMLMQSSDNYDSEMAKLLDTFGVKPEKKDFLLQHLAAHDINRYTDLEREANSHISGWSLEPEELDNIKKLIRSTEEISSLLLKQCKDLKFDC